MFIKINNKEELISKLKKNQEKLIVIHYNCSNCDDEQVTDSIIMEDYMIKQFEDEECLYVTYSCTNCGFMEKFLKINHIQGIEI